MPTNAAQFYWNKTVRSRIDEYMGWSEIDDPRHSVYFSAKGIGARQLRGEIFKKFDGKEVASFKKDHLNAALAHGLAVFPSAWRRNRKINAGGAWILMDIEYYNSRWPNKSYDAQKHVFGELLEPVYQNLCGQLDKNGVEYMTVMTGQGYHISTFVPEGTVAHRGLQDVGTTPDSLRELYSRVKSNSRKDLPVSREEGLAFDGAGRVLANVYYNLMKDFGESRLPLTLCDAFAGNRDGEGVSLDWSFHTDPLHMRVARSVFSMHYKGPRPIIALPRHYKGQDGEWHNESLDDLFEGRGHFDNAIELASRVDARLPDGSEGVERLVENYRESPLLGFHQEMDNTKMDKEWDWNHTYDAWPRHSDKVPPCVRKIVGRPNDQMLKPIQLQALTRFLLAEGWHPKHIAGLIYSKYDKPWLNWHTNWDKYDSRYRATKWVELYAGAIVAGADGLVDWGCPSHQDKGLCERAWCGHNLGNWRVK